MESTGKKVIVTGGARGLGRQFAMDLKARGAKPFVVDVVQDTLDTLKKDTGIPGKVLDVTKEKDVEAFFDEYTKANGAPDVLINNAGVTADGLFIKKKGEEVTKFSYANWDKVINVNLNGVFLCGREAAYQMVKTGTKGVIINISSICRAGNLGQCNYSATKAAVVALTVTWSKELIKSGIRVGAIAPGYINTEMVAKIKPEMLEKIVATVPLGRLGEMSEISKAVQFIIDNDYFSGRVLEVDGGLRL